MEHTSEAGKGLFWMGLNGLGGTLSKLIVSIRPQEYETLSMYQLKRSIYHFAILIPKYHDLQSNYFLK